MPSTLHLSNGIDVQPYPSSINGDGRYLLRKDGTPYLLLSDSPQGMLVDINTTDMITYFSARSNQGFNSSQIHIIAGTTFGGGTNFETYDGVHPFTTDGDISTPNSTYFSRLDSLLQIARSYGICVFLNAGECINALNLWKNNGITKCTNWGAYLGNRYKDYPNIVWMVGNDFQTWSTDQTAVDSLIAIMNGIQSADSNHLIYTAWLDYYVSASRNSSDFNAEITLDAAYTYYIAYDKVAIEYALSPAKPVFLIETGYEGENILWLGTPYLLRKQNYWTMLAGGCGITWMDANWGFPTGWENNLNTTGTAQVGYLKSLFVAYNWSALVPDTTNIVLTAGYGTKATGTVTPNNNDYASCAWITSGSLAIIYMSAALTMTVDMSKFSGTVTARWYDPTNGTYVTDAASPLSNSGTHNFSRAGANFAGDHDWVLVLNT